MTTINNYAIQTRYIIFLFFINVFSTSCLAQQKVVTNSHKKVFSNFCKDLKSSHIIYKPDTAVAGLGVYENVAGKYFDKLEMQKNFEKDTSYFHLVTKFLLVQQSIGLLYNYYNYLPIENLKVLNHAQSKNLAPDWQKSDNEEIEMIENSLLLVFKDAKKEIEIMIIYFNAKNSKIIFLTYVANTKEDITYITDIMTKNSQN